MGKLSRLAVSVAMLAMLSTGCVRRTGDLTVLSTHTLSTTVEKADKRVSGASCKHTVLFGIVIGERNYKQAVDDILNRNPAWDTLVDVVTYESDWSVLGLYGQSCWYVEGTVARIGGGR